MPAANSHSTGERRGGKPRLLLVASDRATRALTREVLDPAEWNLFCVSDGEETIAELIDIRPDLLLLDAGLPDGTLWICEQLRSVTLGEHVPILVLIDPRDRERDTISEAFRAGATDYFVKTRDFRLLPHRVRFILRSSAVYSELRENQVRLSKAQEIADIGHWNLSLEDGSLQWSPEVYRIHGRRPGPDTLGSDDFFGNVHPDDRAMLQDALARALEQVSRFRVEHRIVWPDTTVRVVQQRGEVVLDDQGSVIGLTGTIQDISEQREAQEEIRNLAYFDTLTGLGNRQFFNERLEAAVTHAQRVGGRMAILFFDLDEFKAVNDTLGHATGDALLKMVAERIGRCVRESDVVARNRETARLGGDEFTLILTGLERTGDVEVVAERIRRSIARPFEIEGEDVRVSASIGAAIFPDDGEDASSIVANADMAMYQSKSQGGNCYTFFCASMVEKVQRRKRLSERLKIAVSDGNLSLVYQPIVRLADLRLIGVEALVRWSDPELGTVAPHEFIPVAEETGAIAAIGEWVLREGCRTVSAWEHRFGAVLDLSVNISAFQFVGGRLAACIERTLDETGIDPGRLQLELSDRLVMEDLERSLTELEELAAQGLTVCIEQVGTRPSSLRGLASLPLNALKIDRSFIQRAHQHRVSARLVATLIGIGQALDLKVTAEGLENKAQLNLVRDLRCDFGQGYLFAHPMDDSRVAKLLEQPDLRLTATGT